MRRSIVAGACAALLLAGSAAAWAATDSRRDAPAVTAEAPPDGRQTVGELLNVGKLLGYAAGPKRETFRYPGATYVKVHFDRLTMLPGDHVTVSNPARTESHRLDPSATGRWAMSITGDTAVVEVHRGSRPAGALLGTLGVNVDRVARGFAQVQPERQLTAPGTDGREESVCGGDSSADAVCYKSADPVAYTRSKAVARLLINGTELCTGWRIGTKNRMLTNNHCFETSRAAYDTEVWFNYRCTRCGGYDTLKPTKVWGDRVLATNRTYDYTLFTVENFGRIQPFGYLTLDPVRPRLGQQLFVPQHPAGEPTRIAGALGDRAGTCEVEDNAYDGYAVNSDVSYYCDTEGGSSGSPVLSRKTSRVVALHHFGGCPNSGVRADILVKRLKTYL